MFVVKRGWGGQKYPKIYTYVGLGRPLNKLWAVFSVTRKLSPKLGQFCLMLLFAFSRESFLGSLISSMRYIGNFFWVGVLLCYTHLERIVPHTLFHIMILFFRHTTLHINGSVKKLFQIWSNQFILTVIFWWWNIVDLIIS